MKSCVCIEYSFLLVTDRHCGVVSRGIIHHRQGHVSDSIASVPANAHAVAANRSTVDSSQLVDQNVVAGSVITVAVVNELCVGKPVVAVVEHCV